MVWGVGGGYMAAIVHGVVLHVHGSFSIYGMVVGVHGSGCTGGGCTWQRMYRVGSVGSVDVHRATTKVKNKSLINYSLPGERTLSALT